MNFPTKYSSIVFKKKDKYKVWQRVQKVHFPLLNKKIQSTSAKPSGSRSSLVKSLHSSSVNRRDGRASSTSIVQSWISFPRAVMVPSRHNLATFGTVVYESSSVRPAERGSVVFKVDTSTVLSFFSRAMAIS